MKDVVENMLAFYDVEAKVVIKLAPLDAVHFIPKVGETVSLPDLAKPDRSDFIVEKIVYSFGPNGTQAEEVRLVTVTAHVRRRYIPKIRLRSR